MKIKDIFIMTGLMTVLFSCATYPPEWHYNQGIEAAQSGRVDAAKEAYRMALKDNPGLIQAHNNLGLIYLREGQLPEAERSFKAALAIRADYVVALENLANTYETMGGRAQEALTTWQAAYALETRPEINTKIDQRIKALQALMATPPPPPPTPPTLFVLAPISDETIIAEQVRIIGEASSPVGIDRIALIINGQPLTETDPSTARGIGGVRPGANSKGVAGNESFHFDQAVPLKEGSNEIAVVAYDTQGLSTTRVVNVTQLSPPPTLVLLAPIPEETIATEHVRIIGEVSSPIGIDKITLLINGQSFSGIGEDKTGGIGGIQSGVIPKAGDPPQPFRFDQEVPLQVGSNEIKVIVHDARGRSTIRVVNVTQFSPPPTLVLLAPIPEETIATKQVRIIGEATSPVGIAKITLLINGQPFIGTEEDKARGIGGIRPSVIPKAGDTLQPFRFEQEVPLQAGFNEIKVVAYDTKGRATNRIINVMQILPAPKYYEKSWGIVIGINQYEYWPGLEYAVNDAQAVASKLKELGFDEVIMLTNAEATRQRILNLLGTELPRRVKKEDRLVFFFAGHGQTEDLANGRQKGYLIPVDGGVSDYFATAISMEQVREFSERIPAKHIYYAMDSCYSGLGFTRASGLNPNISGYLEKVVQMRSVQMITAGGKGEQVVERGGHGLFTEYFLRALDGEADTDRDGVVTATELGNFLRPNVSTASNNKQTPQYGRLDGEGEVLFIPPSR